MINGTTHRIGFSVHRIRVTLVVAFVAIASALFGSGPAAADQVSTHVRGHYYLAMGDSLSVGVQPLGPAGANIPTDAAYPVTVLKYLQRSRPGLQLRQVGCPGATALTVLNGGDQYDCGYAGGTQLAVALAFIKTHRVDALTINLGSNDVINGCVTTAGIDRTCVLTAIAALPTTLGSILDQLDAALPTGTPRSGMTYYDPYLGYYAVDPALAHLSIDLTNVLNDTLRGIYRAHGFGVAQVAYLYKMNNGTPVGNPPVPVNVARTCALTWFCTAGNIHPNALGYAKIAEAFAWSLRTWR